MNRSNHQQGVLFALGAYGLWGFMGLYFKVADFVAPTVLLAHRIIWALVFTLILIIVTGRLKNLVRHTANPATLKWLAVSSLLIGANWLIFIWAIQNDKMLEASLGYYINPLVNIAFGMMFLKERLHKIQWIALSFALTGLLFQLVTMGRLPITALSLAVSFACYGLIRKQINIDSQVGLTLETSLMFIPAIVYLSWNFGPSLNFTSYTGTELLILMLAGPVTSIPLMLFASAAKRIPFSLLGFFQYIAPSIMFLMAILLFNEQMEPARWVTFLFTWTALIILSWFAWQQRALLKKQTNQEAIEMVPEEKLIRH